MARKKPAEVVAANEIAGFDARSIVEQHATVLADHETRVRAIETQVDRLIERVNVLEAAPDIRGHRLPAQPYWANEVPAPINDPHPPESPVEALEARVARLEAACAVQLGKHAKHAQAGANSQEPPTGE